MQNSVGLALSAPLQRHFFLLLPRVGSPCCCSQVEPAYDSASILAHKTAPETQQLGVLGCDDAKMGYAFPFTGLHAVQVFAALIQFLLLLHMHRPSLQTCQCRLLSPVYKYPSEINESLAKISETGGVDRHKKKLGSLVPSRVQRYCFLYVLDIQKIMFS